MQGFDNFLIGFLVICSTRVVLMQKTVEIGIIRENLRTDEVEECEELLHVVLQGRSGDKHLGSGVKRAQRLVQLAFRVLQAVCLT